ncbi:MAG: hypothetical protein NT076_00065 [Candidatus Pacearchaeota archaeon]|nr:hypothetical protein [Candidatus Pacearchaeota archaeon]
MAERNLEGIRLNMNSPEHRTRWREAVEKMSEGFYEEVEKREEGRRKAAAFLDYQRIHNPERYNRLKAG